MDKANIPTKRKEWIKRYVHAEILGTFLALVFAWSTYATAHSFVAAAASGWIGEGIGFYGYFITAELISNNKHYHNKSLLRRLSLTVASASTNLIVEFLPAELLDNFIIRPFAMYEAPQYIHPYPIGFLAGKFGSDLLFYALAIVGYETRKKYRKLQHLDR